MEVLNLCLDFITVTPPSMKFNLCFANPGMSSGVPSKEQHEHKLHTHVNTEYKLCLWVAWPGGEEGPLFPIRGLKGQGWRHYHNHLFNQENVGQCIDNYTSTYVSLNIV